MTKKLTGEEYVPYTTEQLEENYRQYGEHNGNGNGTHKKVEPPPKIEWVDAVDVLYADLPMRQWIIPDILPVGLTSLVAKGKVGKSFTLLEMCLNLVQSGKILYLDLEGDDLLLQERMRDILQGDELQRDRLYFTHKAEKINKGLLEQIQQSLSNHPGTTMVIVDVYGIVQATRTEADVYHSDSKTWTELHNFAHDNHIALVVLHHTNKRQNVEDPFDLISGSTGISGSCDSQWCLLRTRNTTTATLYISGRAIIRDIKIVFELGNFSGAYKIMREDGLPEMNTCEKKVWRVLAYSKAPLSPKKIAELTGEERVTVRSTLRRMLSKNRISQTPFGLYQVMQQGMQQVATGHEPASQADLEGVATSVASSCTDTDVATGDLPICPTCGDSSEVIRNPRQGTCYCLKHPRILLEKSEATR